MAKTKKAKDEKTQKAVKNVIFTTLPYHQLYLSPDNVRVSAVSKSKDDELRASIAAVGIFQNLVVVKDDDDERYAVYAGGRRYLRLGELIAEGKFTDDYATPVAIVDKEHSLDMSLMENISHEPMNKADMFLAFNQLIKSGKTINEVARHYEISELEVKRILKLANASAEVMNDFRNKTMSIEQLIALCLTDDHKIQNQIWFADVPSWEKNASHIKKQIMAENVTTDHRKVKFVGLSNYLDNGGKITVDLFTAEGSGGYICDMALLNQMVALKLNESANAIKNEGWAWVECAEEMDFSYVHSMKRIHKIKRDMTEDELHYKLSLDAQQEALNAEVAQHEEATYESDEDYEQVENALNNKTEALDNEINAFDNSLLVWDDKRSRAGVYLYINQQGELGYEYGLINAVDYKAMQAESEDGNLQKGGCADVLQNNISQSLKDNLMAHRTGAMQVALLSHSNLAIVLLTHRLVLGAFDKYRFNSSISSVQIDGTAPVLLNAIPDYPQTKSAIVMAEHTDKWLLVLPDLDNLLDWLLAQPNEVVSDLLTYCIARTLSLTHNGHNRNYKKIADILSFSMSDWWEPTTENYFSRVSKDEMKSVLEATHQTVNGDIDKMKKADMAQKVADKVIGLGWLPELLVV